MEPKIDGGCVASPPRLGLPGEGPVLGDERSALSHDGKIDGGLRCQAPRLGLPGGGPVLCDERWALSHGRIRWGVLLLGPPGPPESASVARWVQPRLGFVNSGR